MSVQSTPGFPSSPLPPITPRTHIIALLGSDNAKPSDGGWFAADICLLNRLFVGLGQSQAWFTMIDFGSVTREDGPILYGNPKRPRRVVCSEEGQLHNIRVHAKGRILNDCLAHLALVCDSAATNKEHVLVMLFGHGEGSNESSAFEVGAQKLRPGQMQQPFQEVQQKIGPLKTSLLMTSCYSGGWVVHDVFNSTTMAAAQEGQQSDKPAIEYKDWTDNVAHEMDQLFAVGSDPKFSAQDDSWDAKYDEATGIQRATYCRRYAALPLVSPNLDLEGHPIFLTGHNPIAGRLYALVRQYLSIRPGLDTKPSNNLISASVAQFLNPSLPYPKPFTTADAVFLSTRLRLRLGLAHLAETYIDMLRLRPFRSFSMFHEHEMA
ncbi:MAG: hypothetical protein M1816_006492 [Peltula sp. TS41687]|nr:MAG: hypothetical protein M1816_006492 [Peltula sp. TS41687]